MSCPLTCSHLVRQVCGIRCAAANHWTASVYIRTVLPDLPSAARQSRNEPISGWNTPAASGLGCREHGPGTLIVCLSSCERAAAQLSAGQRFRWSETPIRSPVSAIMCPLFLRFTQVRGPFRASRDVWSGAGSNCRPSAFQASCASTLIHSRSVGILWARNHSRLASALQLTALDRSRHAAARGTRRQPIEPGSVGCHGG